MRTLYEEAASHLASNPKGKVLYVAPQSRWANTTWDKLMLDASDSGWERSRHFRMDTPAGGSVLGLMAMGDPSRFEGWWNSPEQPLLWVVHDDPLPSYPHWLPQCIYRSGCDTVAYIR